MSIYQEYGYESRTDYLRNLSEESGLAFTVVYELSQILGETEDFDGLVIAIEDYTGDW